MEAMLSVPNAIVFILDPETRDIKVPQYDSERTAASNAACVSIKTLADVDGDVTIRLEKRDAAATDNLEMVFAGEVETPNQRLAVVTSSFERIVETAVPGGLAKVTVAVDDPASPALIVISFE